MLKISCWAVSFDDKQMNTLEDYYAFHFQMQFVYYNSKHYIKNFFCLVVSRIINAHFPCKNNCKIIVYKVYVGVII